MPSSTSAPQPPADRTMLIMEFQSGLTSTLLEMERQEVLELTQERARRVFGSTKGTARPRDLRIVDPAFSDGEPEPAIVVRMLSLLVCLDNVRAIVLPDRVLLVIPEGGDAHIGNFRRRLTELSEDKEHQAVPFELRTLETILSLAADGIQAELDSLLPRVMRTTDRVIVESNRVTLEVLREVRNSASRLQLRALANRGALDQFLNDDRDMAMTNFSAILADPSRFADGEPDEEWISQHDEVEMMVEAYLQQVDASLSQINLLELDMEAVESTVMLRLDATRNRLLKVETSIMALTSACGVGAMVAGIFGMNLNSGVQQADYWFWTVAGILVFGAALFVALFMLFVIRRGYLLT